ncbi:hypothetical protein Hanom_Chr08g00689521 [Helianthus anomalus]
MSITSEYIAMIAVGSSVNMYDLRKFNNLFYSKCVDIQIKCVRPYLDQGNSVINFHDPCIKYVRLQLIYIFICFNAGFAAGSVEGRVALKHFNPANQDNDGYVYAS